MVKQSDKQFRSELVGHLLSYLVNSVFAVFFLDQLDGGAFRVLLWAELGFSLALFLVTLYRLLHKPAFRQALLVRNDERHDLILEKSRVVSYYLLLACFGAMVGFGGMSEILGLTVSVPNLWQLGLILTGVAMTSYAVAKLWYQYRL